MSLSLTTSGLRRTSFTVAAVVPVAGFAVALVAHERYTTAHGTGFVGYELVHGPVYRSGTLILLAGELCLLAALTVWYLGLRPAVPQARHVPWLIGTAVAVALGAAVIVTATARSDEPVDVAVLGVGVLLLFGAACFELGRSAGRSRPLARVSRLLRAVPFAALVLIVARNSALETPALLLFGALCLGVSLLVPQEG